MDEQQMNETPAPRRRRRAAAQEQAFEEFEREQKAAAASEEPAAGRPGNQHLFTFTDVQIDVVQGRLCLCGVLKAEVLKMDNGFLLQWGFLLTNKGRRLRLPLKVWYYSLLRLPALVLVAA